MYKQPIILFGIVLPLLGIFAAMGAFYVLKSRMTESFAQKTSEYGAYSMSQKMAMETEGRVRIQREHLARWKKDLSAETTSTMRTHLKAISEKLPPKEFQETNFEPASTKTGLGVVSAQKSSQIRLGFRGTFRSVQRALLELETRMPQLQLQDLKVSPSSQSSLLNFQITYIAWEN